MDDSGTKVIEGVDAATGSGAAAGRVTGIEPGDLRSQAGVVVAQLPVRLVQRLEPARLTPDQQQRYCRESQRQGGHAPQHHNRPTLPIVSQHCQWTAAPAAEP